MCVFLDCKLPKTDATRHFSGIVDNANMTLFNNTGSLNCETGYRVNGTNKTNADTDVKITCTKEGTWTTAAITCVKKGTNLKSMFAYFNILALVH